MSEFSQLERNILKAKGATEEDVEALRIAGVTSRVDFATIGDQQTLLELVPGLDGDVARKLMEWAVGVSTPPAPKQDAASPGPVLVDSADVVYCTHCKTKQPKDYKSGDLCFGCGKQAEPIFACFWCSASGPGRFCRSCGAEFVPTGELDLAILLRREGLPKEDIPNKLRAFTTSQKDDLWGRVRRSRG